MHIIELYNTTMVKWFSNRLQMLKYTLFILIIILFFFPAQAKCFYFSADLG